MGGWLGGMEVTYMLHSYHGLWRDVARMRCNGKRRDHGLGEIMGGVSWKGRQSARLPVEYEPQGVSQIPTSPSKLQDCGFHLVYSKWQNEVRKAGAKHNL